MKFDIAALERAFDDMKTQLGGGLVSTSIWDRRTERRYLMIKEHAHAAMMFNALTDSIAAALDNSGFPRLNRYYLIDLEQEHVVVIIRHGDDTLQGVLVNAKHCNVGLLLTVVVPRLLRQIRDARVE